MERDNRDYSTVNVLAIKELSESIGWREFVKEANLWIEDLKDILVETKEDDDKNRGRIDGIETMLQWPEQVLDIAQLERENTRDLKDMIDGY